MTAMDEDVEAEKNVDEAADDGDEDSQMDEDNGDEEANEDEEDNEEEGVWIRTDEAMSELALMVERELASLRGEKDEQQEMEEIESDVMKPDWFGGGTALQVSCLSGKINYVRELLNAKADANETHPQSGNTALHVIVMTPVVEDEMKADIIKLLLNAKADVTKTNDDGDAPSGLTEREDLRRALGVQSLALHTAAVRRNAEALQACLDEIKADSKGSVSVDVLDSDGWTALHIASYRPANACASLLIQARASVNVLTKDTWQAPLHLAARSGSFDIAKELLEARADIHSFESDEDHDWDYTSKSYERNPEKHKQALHLASEVANIPFMRMMLGARADVNALDSYGCSPLHLAIENVLDGDDELPPTAGVRIINGAGNANGRLGAIVGSREVCNDTACKDPDCMSHAQERQFPVLVEGSLEQITLKDANVAPVRSTAVDRLLEARADVSIGNHKIGIDQSMLHQAVHMKHLSLAQTIINHDGAVVNQQRSGSGFAPLHFAVRQRHAEMIKLLRKAGADVNLADSSGNTAIDLAAANRLPARAAALLMDEKAVQSAPTACMVAAACIGDVEIVKASIAAKACVEQMSKHRVPALERAMQSQNEDIVKLLIGVRCNIPEAKARRKRPLKELYLN